MYELSVDGHFSAAHFLKGYDGDCGRMHGHTWKVTVTVSSQETGELGMALDFKMISEKLDSAIDPFDHRVLNEHEAFSAENPTAENIARYLFDRLSRDLNSERIMVTAITVAESERYRVTYRRDER